MNPTTCFIASMLICSSTALAQHPCDGAASAAPGDPQLKDRLIRAQAKSERFRIKLRNPLRGSGLVMPGNKFIIGRVKAVDDASFLFEYKDALGRIAHDWIRYDQIEYAKAESQTANVLKRIAKFSLTGLAGCADGSG